MEEKEEYYFWLFVEVDNEGGDVVVVSPEYVFLLAFCKADRKKKEQLLPLLHPRTTENPSSSSFPRRCGHDRHVAR